MISSQVAIPEVTASDVDELCQYYLKLVYQDMVLKAVQRKNEVISEANGEILYDSMDKLLAIMALTDEDVFVDLGSGAGKVVAQVFLKSPVKEACGIEIVPELHHQASAAAERIREDLPDFYLPHRQLTFLLGSLFEMSLDRATVVFVNSICFTQPMLQRLGRIINDTSSIRLLLTTRPLPTLERLKFKGATRIEGSWDSALCYIYG